MDFASQVVDEAKSQEVLLPSALFALLSPGLILSLPSMKLNPMMMSSQSVLIHAALFGLALWHVSSSHLGKSLSQHELLVPVILFVLLSPGLLLQVPPGSWRSGMTSLASIAVHALLFAALYSVIRLKFPAPSPPPPSQ